MLNYSRIYCGLNIFPIHCHHTPLHILHTVGALPHTATTHRSTHRRRLGYPYAVNFNHMLPYTVVSLLYDIQRFILFYRKQYMRFSLYRNDINELLTKYQNDAHMPTVPVRTYVRRTQARTLLWAGRLPAHAHAFSTVCHFLRWKSRVDRYV